MYHWSKFVHLEILIQRVYLYSRSKHTVWFNAKRVKVWKSLLSVFRFFFFFFLKGTFAEEYDLHHSFSDSCKLFKLRNLVQEKSLAFRNLSSHTQQTSVQLNDRNTRKSFGISHWRCSGVFILSFKPVSHLFLSSVSVVSFQLVRLYEIG